MTKDELEKLLDEIRDLPVDDFAVAGRVASITAQISEKFDRLEKALAGADSAIRELVKPDEPCVSKTVTRYEPNLNGHMAEMADGDWVRYDDIKHLLQDEPTAERICHWRCCTKPMAPDDSYLCAEHRAIMAPVTVNRPAEPRARIDAGLRYKPVLERASNTREGWTAEMEQAHDGEWVHVSALNRGAES
jgi:hypothetical protein